MLPKPLFLLLMLFAFNVKCEPTYFYLKDQNYIILSNETYKDECPPGAGRAVKREGNEHKIGCWMKAQDEVLLFWLPNYEEQRVSRFFFRPFHEAYERPIKKYTD
ncbi:hypothetical protein [Xanthomonas phage DES1]|nr:hypothetical protein [Xanthomonas phage DES1]